MIILRIDISFQMYLNVKSSIMNYKNMSEGIAI